MDQIIDMFQSILSTGMGFVENYGWYILCASIISLYLYHTHLKDEIQKYLNMKSDQEYSAKYHKNPDLLNARLIAQQQYAEKLQAKYEKDALEYQQKLEEKEAKKKEEQLAKLELKENGGNTLGYEKKPGFKPDYHPLTGGGSSSNYRPPRRSPCGGGGCG